MIFLFDPGYPPSLVKAIDLTLNIGKKNTVSVMSYTEDVQDDLTKQPVIFLTDDAKQGVNQQTRLYVESGYRVFAYKFPWGKQRNRLDMALTMMQLLPKILREIQATTNPFLCIIRHKANRLSFMTMKPPKPAIQLSEPKADRNTRRTRRPKYTQPDSTGVLQLFLE